MKAKTHTGGRKEFVDDGKPLGDTQFTTDFKEKYNEWVGRKRVKHRATRIIRKSKPRTKLVLEFAGLGLVTVGLIFYKMNNAKLVLGIGIFLFAVSLMVKKK